MRHVEEFNYRNIAISGVAGTGSTTLLKLLREALQADGWTGFSGGEYMRQFTTNLPDREHHDAEDYDESVDRRTDMSIRQRFQEGSGLIIESWLSGFMAQGVPGVLKILLTCSNDLDRAKRLAERDNMEPDEAMLKAFQRLETNFGRWKRMYAKEWDEWVVQTGILPAGAAPFFWHPSLYDLVIDTAVYSPDKALEITLEKLKSPDIVMK